MLGLLKRKNPASLLPRSCLLGVHSPNPPRVCVPGTGLGSVIRLHFPAQGGGETVLEHK